MKVVILAGGFGSRLSEESYLRPKPMIEIGSKPILWHIMKNYAVQGFNEFVICAGYRQHMVKEYFADLYLHSSNITFDYTSGTRKTEVHGTTVEPWRVTIVDTGLNTLTAGRINRIREFVEGERFLLTYGDGLSDVNYSDLIDFHEANGAIVTLTASKADQRFGVLDISPDNKVEVFREKSAADDGFINGGFMVCEPELFEYFEREGSNPDNEDFSAVTLTQLAKDGQLAAYRHTGFWACMDTQRDKMRLIEMWESGNAPWKTW